MPLDPSPDDAVAVLMAHAHRDGPSRMWSLAISATSIVTTTDELFRYYSVEERSEARPSDPQPYHQRFLTIEGSFLVEKTDPGTTKRLTQAPEDAKAEQ